MPAATIVAAWMRADAGVGPSMASGSQSWKGNEARLARDADEHADEADGEQASGPGTVSTAMRSVLRARTASAMRPTTMPMSATRVTRNAL